MRSALEEMDGRNEERRIYEAAKNESAELVWKHRNPTAAEEEKVTAYAYPDLKKEQYTHHLEKGAHARSQSQSYGELVMKMPPGTFIRSASSNSSGSEEGRPSVEIQGSSRSRFSAIIPSEGG